MTTLADFVRTRMTALGFERNKDLASRFHDLYDNQAAGDSIAVETVAPKLSKLLKGEVEGERFFFGDARRTAAFAQALQVTTDELLQARAADADTITLVLDPRLDKAAIGFLSGSDCPRFRCVVVPFGADARTNLRDAAKAQRNGTWIVTQNEEDVAFFDFADVRVTLIEKVPRGWKLEKLPDLVPIPEPTPPKLWDDDGTPLMPCKALEQRYSYPDHYRHDPLAQRTKLAQQREETPTYPILDALRATSILSSDYQERTVVRSVDSKLRLEPPRTPSLGTILELPQEPKPPTSRDTTRYVPETHLFWKDRKLYALGPGREPLASALAPWHTIEKPRWADLSSLTERNPFFRFRPSDPEQEKRAQAKDPSYQPRTEVLTESGDALLRELAAEPPADLTDTLITWAKIESAKRPQDRPLNLTAWLDRQPDRECRAELMKLLDRSLALTTADLPYVFVLRQLSRAPIIRLTAEAPESLHLAVTLGAGHWLRVVAVRYRDPPLKVLRLYPSPAEPNYRYDTAAQGFELDGGDVHLWFFHHYSDKLEATTLPLRARSAAENHKRADDDARARYDDDDDW